MSIPTGVAFAKALEEAGVISDLDSITRIVIDIQPGDAAHVYVERIGEKRLLDAFKGPLGMMLAENAPEPAPKGVRYWVLVSRELLDSRAWAQAGLRKIELGAWEDRHQVRWVLFEDPGASPKLDGLEVELTFEQHGFDAPRITGRTPVMHGAVQESGAHLQYVAEHAPKHAADCALMLPHAAGECQPEHAADCDRRTAHQVPEECLHIHPAVDGPVT